MNTSDISKLVKNQPGGHSLGQAFYKDPDIYQREIERIFMKSWLYAGHTSQVPNVGDYFLYELDNESVIVIRETVDSIKGLLNVCRHRGSRVCLSASGNANLLVCPYHGWTYEKNGQLRGASHTYPGFKKSKYPLTPVNLKVFHGMIFINFDKDPISFDPVEKDMDECLQPYRLDKAKVAHTESYQIKANWKLAVENYCECYHCVPSHPEYAEAHGRSFPRRDMEEALQEVFQKGELVGLPEHNINYDWLDSGGVGIDRSFDRYPLLKGFVTGSRDGKAVAPLLGEIKGYDGGATDMHIGPLTFYLAYCDHVVVYHFKPVTIDSAECEITWLVNETAVEGKDYKPDDLIWLWDITTIADKRIIEDNQKGVNSRYYEPGPFTEMEVFEQGFIDWYLSSMK
ncbi:MAG: aromatic ring-hydroxylating dioxygenase subunit alpha [Gammaproteobacteria bacterium]|nr:aromatic ring-hydroxylating dioxygenase subunit alpha [Gammaproteobacteria bacterium]